MMVPIQLYSGGALVWLERNKKKEFYTLIDICYKSNY